MRWIVCGARIHSICICVRGGKAFDSVEGRMQCDDFCLVPEGSPPPARRLRNHLRVVTSTHVCIVADIIVHNHEMMMSWCAQSRWMLGATLLFILLLFEARFVGAWLLEKKKIAPNLAKHFLLPVGKNNAESSPWRKSVFHTHTHLRVEWDRLKTRGLGHEKHKYDFLERSVTVACSQFRTGLIRLPAELWAAQSKKQRHCRRPQRKEAQLKQRLDT